MQPGGVKFLDRRGEPAPQVLESHRVSLAQASDRPPRPVPFATVATRKLIFAALVCGLAILLAGGVWLVSSSSSDDDSGIDDLLQMGQPATLGGVTATVADAQTAGPDAVVIVDMSIATGGPSEVTDLSTGWSLLSPTGAAVTPAPDAQPPATIESCTGGHDNSRCADTLCGVVHPERADGIVDRVHGGVGARRRARRLAGPMTALPVTSAQ